MIRVAVFNWKDESFRVDFDRIPVQSDNDCRSDRQGALGLDALQQIAQELQEGRVGGWVSGYRWYRQVNPAGNGNRSNKHGNRSMPGRSS